MDTGFVLSDKVRLVVLTAIGGGEQDLAQVAKRHHLVARAVERAATELADAKLVSRGNDGRWTVTESGNETLRAVKRTEGR
jgi:Mn-dependent DtxR family transcriptional regulator